MFLWNVEEVRRLLNKSVTNENESFEIIGSEIKIKRKEQSLTLKELAYKTFSISYLSKVENHAIQPNITLLNEICEKVNIKQNDIVSMMKSNDIYDDIMMSYFKKDFKKIEEIYIDTKNLKNYRFMIMNLVYCLSIKDFKKFNLIFKKIILIAKTLNNSDLYYFIFISAIYYYEISHLNLSASIFNELKKYRNMNFGYESEIEKYLVKIFFRLNSSLFYEKSLNIISNSYNNNNDNFIVEYKKLKKKFEIRNLILVELKQNCNVFMNREKIVNLISEYENIDGCRAYYSLLKDYLNDFTLFKTNFTSNVKFENIMEEYVLDYLKLKLENEDRSINYLVNVCLVEAYKKYDIFYIQLFKIELQKYYVSKCKYKKYYELEMDFNLFVKKLDVCY